MQFGYTIFYVENVRYTLEFFNRAFGLEIGYTDPVWCYGELNTGATSIAFASMALGRDLVPTGLTSIKGFERPVGVEIGLFTEDVEAAFKKAIDNGAVAIASPKATPWGQIVSFVKTPDDILVEICTRTAR